MSEEKLEAARLACSRRQRQLGPSGSTILFASTIFSGAFLLFLVQPIAARQILPWFGGSATVWLVCMVFFQVVLLAGYAYSDWISRHLQPRRQVALHIALLVSSLTFLPIIAAPHWRAAPEADPTSPILGLLVATIGLPYFLLSTTGPLIQTWAAHTVLGTRVYRYFSLSNLASLVALISYPFVIEPHVRLHDQAVAWSIVYLLFVSLCSASAWYFLSRAPVRAAKTFASDPVEESVPVRGEYLLWIALSALGTWLLLAITNHLTQNVASIPFLWLLPLTIYLLTFVLCFESDRWYRRSRFLLPAAALLLLCAYGLQHGSVGATVRVAIPVYSVGLFFFCMFLHGELSRMRPEPRYLTRYYLMLSLGGALGGIMVGLVAPRVLPAYYELGIGFVLTALLALTVLAPRRSLVLGSAAVAAACSFFLWSQVHADFAEARRVERNFYSTLLTLDTQRSNPRDDARQLYHGSVMHGEQYLSPERRLEPTSYFAPTSGIGRAIAQAPAGSRRIGVIGLGAGIIAAYGRAGDHYSFYEINPEVVELAQSEFSFMKESPARVEVVLGDGRLALERQSPQGFDVLAVDAFSGGAVPVHLITVEALRVYLRHMRPGGIVAFNVTNRYVWLAPVVANIASEVGASAILVHDEPKESNFRNTDWMLVAHDATPFRHPPLRDAASPLAPVPGISAWTDDFSNLFQVLR